MLFQALDGAPGIFYAVLGLSDLLGSSKMLLPPTVESSRNASLLRSLGGTGSVTPVALAPVTSGISAVPDISSVNWPLESGSKI